MNTVDGVSPPHVYDEIAAASALSHGTHERQLACFGEHIALPSVVEPTLHTSGVDHIDYIARHTAFNSSA